METAIYWLLMHSNPQALVDLDSYQHRWHSTGIGVLREETGLPVNVKCHLESIEEIGKLMRDTPSRSRV